MLLSYGKACPPSPTRGSFVINLNHCPLNKILVLQELSECHLWFVKIQRCTISSLFTNPRHKTLWKRIEIATIHQLIINCVDRSSCLCQTKGFRTIHLTAHLCWKRQGPGNLWSIQSGTGNIFIGQIMFSDFFIDSVYEEEVPNIQTYSWYVAF